MVKKISKEKSSAMPKGDMVKDSAQQIWQAGLGAFARAQAEGGKAYEKLVKEGVSIQRKTQAAAEEKINEATAKVAKMAKMANGLVGSKASGQWDKLEGIFEDRVAKALNRLGVPSAKDVSALAKRVEALASEVKALQGKSAAPKAAPKPSAKPAAKAPVKPVAKKAPAKAPAKKASAKPASPSA